MERSIANLIRDISHSEIITLACDDPGIRPLMMRSIVAEFTAKRLQVHYIDFDLQFSSFLQNLSETEYAKISSRELCVFHPNPDSMGDLLLPLMMLVKSGGLIVLDSMNAVQNFLSEKNMQSDGRIANHRSAVLITVFQQIARFYSKTILILNLTKSRLKRIQEGSATWEKVIVGGRLTRFKSDAILFANKIPPALASSSPRIRVAVTDVSSNTFGGNVGDVYEIDAGTIG